MKFDVVRNAENYMHVALSGRLDPDGVREKGFTFHEYTAEVGKPCIVDLSGVEYMASLGIGMIMQAAKALAASGARMVLVNPATMVEGTLRSAGITGVIPICRDEAEAMKRLGLE